VALDEQGPQPPALAIPLGAGLGQGSVQPFSLHQAQALAWYQSPELEDQRLAVARALADLEVRLG
jgi:hypothetical protein